MASVRKRPSDEKRGPLGKYTCYFIGADGKQRSKAGFTDKAKSERLANRLEEEAKLIREGLADPREKTRREASLQSIAQHAEAYRLDLIHKGDTPKHCKHIKSTIIKVMADAHIKSVNAISPDLIRGALGRMKASGKSARTCNHALGAVKAFTTWLHESNRLADLPRGLKSLQAYSEDADRRLERRALTKEELSKLLEAAEQGPPMIAAYGASKSKLNRVDITGPQRAMLYRLAMGTGFRANELRSLTPERFHLEGEEPYIALRAKDEKNRKGAEQPITRDLAERLRPIVAGATPGEPILPVPTDTAKMLRADLERAGIAYQTEEGVIDFHAIRASFVTHLIDSGVNIKEVQILARHSTPILTLARYAKTDKVKLRAAIESNKDP